MNEQIVILDFGSQYTQVIARRIRECNVYSVILRYDTPAAEIVALQPRGIILSGGPSSVYAADAPLPDKEIFNLGVPVLGICYGLQLIAHYLGGKVEKGLKREYGKGTLQVKDGFCPLFANLPEILQVWNSHGDQLTKIPHGFKAIGTIPVRMLILCAPAGFEHFVLELGEDPNSPPAPPDTAKLVALGAKYGIDILGPLPDE